LGLFAQIAARSARGVSHSNICGVRQVGFIDNVVAVENCASFPADNFHRRAFRDAEPAQISAPENSS
jgi:hypothetical protein